MVAVGILAKQVEADHLAQATLRQAHMLQHPTLALVLRDILAQQRTLVAAPECIPRMVVLAQATPRLACLPLCPTIAQSTPGTEDTRLSTRRRRCMASSLRIPHSTVPRLRDQDIRRDTMMSPPHLPILAAGCMDSRHRRRRTEVMPQRRILSRRVTRRQVTDGDSSTTTTRTRLAIPLRLRRPRTCVGRTLSTRAST